MDKCTAFCRLPYARGGGVFGITMHHLVKEKTMAYVDLVEVSPDVYTVLYENDAVRVLDMTLPAGQTDNERFHTAETVIFLKGGKAHIALPASNSMEAEPPTATSCGANLERTPSATLATARSR